MHACMHALAADLPSACLGGPSYAVYKALGKASSPSFLLILAGVVGTVPGPLPARPFYMTRP